MKKTYSNSTQQQRLSFSSSSYYSSSSSLGNQENLRLLDLGGCVGIGVGTSISLGSLSGPHIELNETPGGENGLRDQIMRGTSVQTADREGSRVLHVLRVQRPQETVSEDSERGLENLPGERDSLAFGVANLVVFRNRGVVELIAAGAGGGAGPGGGELAEVELGPGGHVGDLGEEGVEGDADDGGAFGGFDAELGFQGRGDEADGGRGEGLGFPERGVVDGGVGEVRDGYEEGFAVAGSGLGGVEGEEDGLEAGEGRRLRGVDAGEVETGEERDEGEYDKAEMGVGGEEGVVEPVAEGVGVGAGEGG